MSGFDALPNLGGLSIDCLKPLPVPTGAPGDSDDSDSDDDFTLFLSSLPRKVARANARRAAEAARAQQEYEHEFHDIVDLEEDEIYKKTRRYLKWCKRVVEDLQEMFKRVQENARYFRFPLYRQRLQGLSINFYNLVEKGQWIPPTGPFGLLTHWERWMILLVDLANAEKNVSEEELKRALKAIKESRFKYALDKQLLAQVYTRHLAKATSALVDRLRGIVAADLARLVSNFPEMYDVGGGDATVHLDIGDAPSGGANQDESDARPEKFDVTDEWKKMRAVHTRVQQCLTELEYQLKLTHKDHVSGKVVIPGIGEVLLRVSRDRTRLHYHSHIIIPRGTRADEANAYFASRGYVVSGGAVWMSLRQLQSYLVKIWNGFTADQKNAYKAKFPILGASTQSAAPAAAAPAAAGASGSRDDDDDDDDDNYDPYENKLRKSRRVAGKQPVYRPSGAQPARGFRPLTRQSESSNDDSDSNEPLTDRGKRKSSGGPPPGMPDPRHRPDPF